MTWVIFALLAYFFWSCSNVGDKVVFSRYFSNALVYLFYGFLFSPIILFFVFFTKIEAPSPHLILFSGLSALLYLLVSIFYIKAVAVEEISRVNLLWNMSPIFSFIIAWLFLGERLDGLESVLFIFLIVAALLASFHAIGKKIKITRGFLYMVITCLFYAMYAVVVKYVSRDVDFYTFYLYFTLWLVPLPFLLFLSKSFRRVFKKETLRLNGKVILYVTIVSVVSRLGVLFYQSSLVNGPVSLINGMEGAQTIMVFLIAALLTRFYPGILREEMDRKNILFKLSALVIVVTVVAVLSFR